MSGEIRIDTSCSIWCTGYCDISTGEVQYVQFNKQIIESYMKQAALENVVLDVEGKGPTHFSVDSWLQKLPGSNPSHEDRCV